MLAAFLGVILGNDMRIDWRNAGPRKHFQTDAISCCFNTEEIIFNSRAQSFHPLSRAECQHETNSCNRKYLHLWTLTFTWSLALKERRSQDDSSMGICTGTSCRDPTLKIVYYGSYHRTRTYCTVFRNKKAHVQGVDQL